MGFSASATAFYVVADSNHFLGVVGMVNSLRLVGHDEPIYVADRGLTESQRERLGGHVTIVDAPGRTDPRLLKTVAPLTHPMDVMILIDADMIVTRRLHELVARARARRVVVFIDEVSDRFDPRWSEVLGLGPLTPHPYFNSGLVVLDRSIGSALLEEVAAGHCRVGARRAANVGGRPDDVFSYPDQDVFNAVLARRGAHQLDLLDHALAPFPPFRGVRLLDDTTLRCSYDDGTEPFVLHHVLAKPWLAHTRRTVYSRLLERLLLGPDVAVPVPQEEVPLRLRRGPLGRLESRRSAAVALLARSRGKLGIRRALEERRRGAHRVAARG